MPNRSLTSIIWLEILEPLYPAYHNGGDVDYAFVNYSGTTLQEPTFGGYYMGYLTDFKLLILNVTTN